MILNYELDNSFRAIHQPSKQLSATLQRSLKKIQNQKKYITQRKKKKDPFMLKKLVKKVKTAKLVENFIKKLGRNNLSRKPIDQKIFEEEQPVGFINLLKKTSGIQVSSYLLILWSLINVIQLSIMVYIFSIIIAFPETQKFSLFTYLRIGSLFLYIIDIILNLITIKYQDGKYIISLYDVGKHYLKQGFLADSLSIIIFIISSQSDLDLKSIILLISLIKLWNNIKKLQKYQYIYIGSKQKQQYFGLIKVFMTNFVIGHFLSFILNLMANLNTQNNWYAKLGISNAQWYIKYIWGYYWGTNIMLTVGFGDISATNYLQAIVLVFVETFSCITLAYNISNVGALISQIRASQNLKKQQLKTFHRMSQDNNISPQLTSKVNNFIQQSFQIKQQFEYSQHDKLLQSLPNDLQSQYQKQSNHILFDSIGFLANLSKKTLYILAQEVIRKVAHPQQIIRKRGYLSQFMILYSGKINFSCKKNRSILNGKTMCSIQIKKQQKPKLISLDFIKNKILKYDLKSSSYSVLYYLDSQDFYKYLKDSSKMDFQFLCMIRDRDQYIIDQNQIVQCQICKNQYHTKFDCHRLHFIPLNQNVISTFIYKQKMKKQQQRDLIRQEKEPFKTLRLKKNVQRELNQFRMNNFKKQQIEEMTSYKKYYPQLLISQASQCKERSVLPNENMNDVAIEKIQCLIKNSQRKNQFWGIEVDQAYNFKYYFAENNPDNINHGRTKRSIQEIFPE